MQIEPYPNDVACAGPEAPKADRIEELIRLLVTIQHRFGNTIVRYNVRWGASGLWADDEQKQEITKLKKQLERAKKRYVNLRRATDS